MAETTTKTKFAGKCAGNPRMVPVLEITPADERAREDAGWTKHNHTRRSTTGKAGAYMLPVPCFFTTTDGAAFSRHMREVHGATHGRPGSLPGKGFRVPARTAGEKLALGKTVTVRLPGGSEIAGQVWSEADPTLIGARKGSAFFAVAEGRTFTFHLDQKRPGEECPGYEYLTGGRQGDRVNVRLMRGPAADMTLVEESPEVPAVETVAPVVVVEIPAAPAYVDCFDCGARDYPGESHTCETRETAAPETVPAPMPAMTRAARKATRRELAASLRAQGIRPEGDAWRDACRDAGLVSVASETVSA